MNQPSAFNATAMYTAELDAREKYIYIYIYIEREREGGGGGGIKKQR